MAPPQPCLFLTLHVNRRVLIDSGGAGSLYLQSLPLLVTGSGGLHAVVLTFSLSASHSDSARPCCRSR